MLQVADELENITKLTAEHPKVQLGTIALPGLPADPTGYLRGVRTVMTGARRMADTWDAVIR